MVSVEDECSSRQCLNLSMQCAAKSISLLPFDKSEMFAFLHFCHFAHNILAVTTSYDTPLSVSIVLSFSCLLAFLQDLTYNTDHPDIVPFKNVINLLAATFHKVIFEEPLCGF